MTEAKKPSKKDAELSRLRKELLQYRSMDLLALAAAHRELPKLGSDIYMGSGVIVTIRNLSGVEKVEPVMIKDGLSKETIAALMADVERTHRDRIEHPIAKIYPKKETAK